MNPIIVKETWAYRVIKQLPKVPKVFVWFLIAIALCSSEAELLKFTMGIFPLDK